MWTTTSGLTEGKLNWAITITSVLGFSLFGYDQGLMSGLISGTEFVKEFPALDEGGATHKSVIQGAVTSSLDIGCFFGAIFTLCFGNPIGRTRLIFAGSIILSIGVVISTAAFGPQWGLGQFVIGRVITGIGNGMNTATIPVWQSECSHSHNRGFLVCFEGAIIAVGTFLAYWVDYGLSKHTGSVQWRFPVALQIVFSISVAIGALLLPESPRWFVTRGLDNEACYVISQLNGTSPDDEAVLTEFNLMKADLKSTEGAQASWKTLFTFGKTQEFQRMIVGSSGQFFQQFTGCNAAIYYSTILFKNNLSLENDLSMILGGIFATVYALATIPSFFMVERVGRRKLYLIGFLGQGLSFIIAMACLIPGEKEVAKGAAVGIFLFVIFFACTLLPLPWIYPPEINPLRTRTAAASVSTCTNWLTNFAVVMFTPVFSAQSDWGIYLFFALVNFLAIPWAWFFYPETAGRQLEEIDVIFAKSHVEGKWPYQIANTMPKLTFEEVSQQCHELGLHTREDLINTENSETALSGSDTIRQEKVNDS